MYLKKVAIPLVYTLEITKKGFKSTLGGNYIYAQKNTICNSLETFFCRINRNGMVYDGETKVCVCYGQIDEKCPYFTVFQASY